jgi:hypothetical protein
MASAAKKGCGEKAYVKVSGAKPAPAGCFALKTNQKQIVRFAQDDTIGGFSAACEAAP